MLTAGLKLLKQKKIQIIKSTVRKLTNNEN